MLYNSEIFKGYFSRGVTVVPAVNSGTAAKKDCTLVPLIIEAERTKIRR